eukprot:m51a1_g12644 hypothetical protein (70) ;mRNA; r:3709-3918
MRKDHSGLGRNVQLGSRGTLAHCAHSPAADATFGAAQAAMATRDARTARRRGSGWRGAGIGGGERGAEK